MKRLLEIVFKIVGFCSFVFIAYVFLVCAGCFMYGDNPKDGYPWWMP